MKRTFYNSRKKLYSILCLFLALFLFDPIVAKADTGNLSPRLMIDFNNNGVSK